jgi:hypothetical protein
MRYGRRRCRGGFRGCHSRRYGGAFINLVYMAPRMVAKEPAVQTTGVIEDSPPVDQPSMSSENPPAYREIATKITHDTHMAIIHQLNEKPIHAAELRKDSGFIMVYPSTFKIDDSVHAVEMRLIQLRSLSPEVAQYFIRLRDYLMSLASLQLLQKCIYQSTEIKYITVEFVTMILRDGEHRMERRW